MFPHIVHEWLSSDIFVKLEIMMVLPALSNGSALINVKACKLQIVFAGTVIH